MALNVEKLIKLIVLAFDRFETSNWILKQAFGTIIWHTMFLLMHMINVLAVFEIHVNCKLIVNSNSFCVLINH